MTVFGTNSLGGLALTRQRPRAASMVFSTLDDKLTDSATIERQVRLAGTSYGTPNYEVKDYGPFRCRISTPSGSEGRDPDRWVTREGFTAVIESPFPPLEQDYITIRSAKLGEVRFQATSTVQFRDAKWGSVLLYHVDLKLPVEGLHGPTGNPLASSPSGKNNIGT